MTTAVVYSPFIFRVSIWTIDSVRRIRSSRIFKVFINRPRHYRDIHDYKRLYDVGHLFHGTKRNYQFLFSTFVRTTIL